MSDVASHCPTCLAEYRSGFDTCADDGSDLVPGPAPEPAPEIPQPRFTSEPGPAWEPVAELSSHEEALLLAGRLQSEAIEAFVDPPEASSYYGAATTAIMQYRFKVLVPPHRVLEAADVIRKLQA